MDDSALMQSTCGRYEIWLHEEIQQSHLLSGPSGIQIVDTLCGEDILTLSNQDWDVSTPSTNVDGFLQLKVMLFGTNRQALALDLDGRRFCIDPDPDMVIGREHIGWNADWGQLPAALEASARARAA